MANFYQDMDPADAVELEKLSRLVYELRENRSTILARYGVDDEIALMEQIYTGKIEEHPAYEHYLSARVLADTRETVRAMLADCLKEVGRP